MEAGGGAAGWCRAESFLGAAWPPERAGHTLVAASLRRLPSPAAAAARAASALFDEPRPGAAERGPPSADSLLLFGGRDGRRVFADLWVGRLGGDGADAAWVRVDECCTGARPSGRSNHAAWVERVGGHDAMLIAGGQDSKGWKKDVFVLDLASWTWSAVATTRVRESRARCAAPWPG